MHLAKRLLKHYPLLLNDIYLSEEYYGENVLHMSAVAGDPSIVKWLLDIGSDFHRRCYGNFFTCDDQKSSRRDNKTYEVIPRKTINDVLAVNCLHQNLICLNVTISFNLCYSDLFKFQMINPKVLLHILTRSSSFISVICCSIYKYCYRWPLLSLEIRAWMNYIIIYFCLK